MTNSNKSYRVNPLVEKLLQGKGQAIMIKGYIGPSEDERIRVYSNPSLSKYVEIAKEDLVHVEQLSNRDADPSMVYIKSTAELKSVMEMSINASDFIRLTSHQTPRTAHGCNSTSQEGSKVQFARARVDDIGPGGGPELPPDWCELGCEQTRAFCEDVAYDFWSWLSCIIVYYSCRYGCIYGSHGSGNIAI